MKKYLALLLIAVLLLGGCVKKGEEKPNDNTENQVKTIDFNFKYEGKTYNLGEVFDSKNYAEPVEYSEVPSCAFEGIDKTYKYDHFEVTTYPVDGEEKLYIIYFLDDEVSTNEGLKISDTFEDMINTYGNDFYREVNLYTYSEGKKNINIIVQNDFVTSIEYSYSVN